MNLQAVAIALNEARSSGAKIPKKKTKSIHAFTSDGKWFQVYNGDSNRLYAALGADGYLLN